MEVDELEEITPEDLIQGAEDGSDETAPLEMDIQIITSSPVMCLKTQHIWGIRHV